MVEARRRLGDLLVDEGLVDKFQLQSALAEQRKWGGRLGRHLVDLGILSEPTLVKALSKLLNVPSVALANVEIPRGVLNQVPVRLAEKHNVIPLRASEDGTRKTLVIATSDPTNLSALDELAFSTGCQVDAVVGGDAEIERAIQFHYYGVADPTRPTPEVPVATQDPQTGDNWEITTGGETRVLPKEDTVGFDPSPIIPPNELTPTIGADSLLASAGSLEELTRRFNSVLRLLVRKRLLTEEEILAELLKG